MKKIDNRQLYGAVAAVAVLAGAGGFGLASLLNRPTPAAATSEAHDEEAEGHGEEGGHAEEAKADEGLIALSPAQVQAAGIQVASVSQGGGGEIRLSGRVAAMVDARASVAASVGGRVERVLVAAGQTVRAGQPLAVIVSGEAATFRAEADAASASAEAARRAYDRDDSLLRQGIIARQEAEASRAQALSAEANVRAARARAAAAGSPNASGRLSVVSPLSGVVTSTAVGPGGFVAQGGVVAEVSDPSRVELVFTAPPTVAGSVRPGAPIRVQGPAGEFSATVVGVAAAAGAETGAAVVRARASSGALPPAGTAVTGALVTGSTGASLTVPSDAVQTVEGGPAVFVAVQGGFRAVPVLIGRQAGGRTEILKGLTGQERIAAANAFLLKAELAKGEAEHGH